MKYIEKFEKIVACLSVSVMAILVFVNVIARFVFNNPLAVADEMSCYLFVLMSFMGTAIAARLAIEVVSRCTPRRRQTVV